jgi:DNA-binding NarL/FixJ family response regulator
MNGSLEHPNVTSVCDDSVADVLLVRVSPSLVGTLPSDLYSRVESGREALALIKLLRFRLLVASLDVPDMPAWQLFEQARRTQSRLKCFLVDERATLEDERRARQTGAGVFASDVPALCAEIVQRSARFGRVRVAIAPDTPTENASSSQSPARAPP